MQPPSASSASLSRRRWRHRYTVVYLALATSLGVQIARFYDARTGFTSLIRFGGAFQSRRLDRLRDVHVYTYPRIVGYDGEFYAQIAVAGNPFDRELDTAIDSPPYRAKRVLLPALAYVLGLGRPAWVLEVYAVTNLVCWLLLAALLARWWFPPTDIHNLVRWAGTMFGHGMLMSLSYSLTDGPALLVIAVGVRSVETNRRWLGAGLLAVAGLIKETSVLAAAVFAPGSKNAARDWRWAAALALCVLPTAVWLGVLIAHYGSLGSYRVLDLPGVAYVKELAAICNRLRAHDFGGTNRNATWAAIALATQVGFVLARPRLDQLWWRIGAAFSLLGLCLGSVSWEGALISVSRVVLPLTLAFNVLAPRTRRGLVLVLVGNLTVLSAASALKPPPALEQLFAHGVRLSYEQEWHGEEHLGGDRWRWAEGDARLRLENPTTEALDITLDFDIASVTDRSVTMGAPGIEKSYLLRGPRRRLSTSFGPFRLPPGETFVILTTPEQPWREDDGKGRRLTFSLHDLRGRVTPMASAR